MTAPDPYDAVAYPGGAFPRTHPGRLAAIARLYDVDAPDPARCRVLEIGCSEGRNLLPMAATLPDATFVGVDPARAPIAAGEARRAAAGLNNVALHRVGVEGIDDAWGPFDYVVCHGVWSWVPPSTRAAILDACRRWLTPRGVAYVSYNTLPGWFMQMPARDLMRRHAAGFEDPAERIEQARAALELMRDGSTTHMQAYLVAAQEVASHVARKDDGYLFHEHLSPHHEPVYFTDFLAAAHGLQFLAEADLAKMFDHDLPDVGREGLALLGTDLLGREQLLDFLRGETFRSTLLVKDDVRVSRVWKAERLRGLWFRSRLEALPDGSFKLGRKQVAIDGDVPAPLSRLQAAAPDALPYEAIAKTPAEGAQVLELLSRGVVDPSALPPAWSLRATERPRATSLARVEAAEGALVVALDHTTVQLTEAQRAMVVAADGRARVKGGGALARSCLWLE